MRNRIKLACLMWAVVGCASAAPAEPFLVSAQPEALRAALVAADAQLEAEGVDPQAIEIVGAGADVDATWSSCFDAPDSALFIFNADSSTLVADAKLALAAAL